MEKGKLLGQGRTAEIYEYGQNILKLFIRDVSYKAVESEYRKSIIAQGLELPIPKVMDLIEVGGRLGIVCERIEGQTMLHRLVKNPLRASKYAKDLAQLHNMIHSKEALELPSQREKLRENIQGAPMLTKLEKEKVLGVLDSLPDDNRLCHGDFHPDNIMISPRGPVIIDWLDGVRGNPLADVARTTILLSSPSLPPGTPFVKGRIINLIRLGFFSKYITEYTKLSAVSWEQISKWMLPVACARLTEDVGYEEEQFLLNIINKAIIDI